MISHDSNANFELFRELLRHVLGGTDDQRKEKRACKMYNWNSLYGQTLKYSTVIANHSATFDTIRAELIAFKMPVQNYGYILDDALKLCPQEVILLPEIPTVYMDDSTYLVTSRDDDYTLFNYSRGAKERGEPISGCRSCLLRPSCDGRIETPDGALVLVPDPRTCQYETGLTVTIRQHPLIRTLFPGVMIPEILREQARSEMVEALRLNLIKLPEGSVDEEALSEIAKPFADEILRKHTAFH